MRHYVCITDKVVSKTLMLLLEAEPADGHFLAVLIRSFDKSGYFKPEEIIKII